MKRFASTSDIARSNSSSNRKKSRREEIPAFIPQMLQQLDDDLAAAGRQQQICEICNDSGIPSWVHMQAMDEVEEEHQQPSSDTIDNLDLIDVLVQQHMEGKRIEDEDSLYQWLNAENILDQ